MKTMIIAEKESLDIVLPKRPTAVHMQIYEKLSDVLDSIGFECDTERMRLVIGCWLCRSSDG